MIDRQLLLKRTSAALKRSRVVALVGPRQCGKTTIARMLVEPDSVNYFDLENPISLARLLEPMTALSSLKGLVVIDEVQRRPELFPILRVLADRSPLTARFLLLGSASPALLQQTSESLAGRIEIIDVTGFSLAEVGISHQEKHWRRGGFPLSFLAKSEADSSQWRQAFIRTLVERDLPQLGIKIAPAAIGRFWAMLAHYHGQIWNAAEPARSLGASEPTVRRYLDLLTSTYLVRQLPPWHENLGKRQVKAPKIYIRDTGLLHTLLGLTTSSALHVHPKIGASWEGYVVEEIIKALQPDAINFWATHQGAELDLFLPQHHGKRIGFEIKRADAPQMTKSMLIAMQDLRLDRLLVIYPGSSAYALSADRRINVVPAADIAAWHPKLRF